MGARLKDLKAGDPVFIECNDLTIKEKSARGEHCDGRRHIRICCGAALAISRQQRDPAPFLVGENSIAVILFLVDPALPVEGLRHKCGYHRLNAEWDLFGHLRFPRLPISCAGVALFLLRAVSGKSPMEALSTSPPPSWAICESRHRLVTDRGSSDVMSRVDAY